MTIGIGFRWHSLPDCSLISGLVERADHRRHLEVQTLSATLPSSIFFLMVLCLLQGICHNFCDFFLERNILQAKFLERTKGDFNAKFVKPKRGKGQGKKDESSSFDISMLSCSDDSMGDSLQPLEPEVASLWLGDEPMLGDDASLPDLEPALTSLLIDEASPCLRSMPSLDTIDSGHIYLNHSSVNWPTLSASVDAPRGFDEVMGKSMAELFPLKEVAQPSTPESLAESCASTVPDTDHDGELISRLDDFMMETQKLLGEPIEQPVDFDVAFADTLVQEDAPPQIVNGSQTQVRFFPSIVSKLLTNLHKVVFNALPRTTLQET